MSSDLVRAYDLDGTLCDHTPKRGKSFFKQTGEERRAYEQILRNHYRNALLIRKPIEPFVIITGRKEKFRSETEAWLADHGLRPLRVYMLKEARTRENMIRHKAGSFREAGASIYYEDDPEIAKDLAGLGVPVVLVT